jgi:signal transduction histidine kinase
MRTRLWGFGAALAVLLLVPVLVLGWRGRQQLLDADRYKEELQQLSALTHRLPSEVTKSRAGVVGHYDGLVQTEAGLRRKLRELQAPPVFLAGWERSMLVERLDGLRKQLDRAFLLVDEFKRTHSVLRNSLRYLPVMAREFDEHPAVEPNVLATTRLVDDLIRDALLMQSWSDEVIGARISQHLAQVERVLDATPADERARLDLALAHVRNVSRLGPRVRSVTNQVIGLGSEERGVALLESFERIQARMHLRNEQHWLLGYALALIALCLGAASVITRIKQSEVAQRKASQQLTQTVAALEAERAKQQQLADLKSRFVSMTSHEFRTPLSVILSSSEMLEAYEAKWPAERKADHFGRIRTAALGMTRMLDSILLIGRSDSGLLRFEPRRVELREFCTDVVDAVGQASGQRERIVWDGLERPVEAEVDDGLLRHVLENLLSNALKYSAVPRPVAFDVHCADESVVFRVSDEGIGITDEDREQLFGTFHRGRNVGQRPGSGLGLAIVKRAVALHGGQVSVESKLGSGSTFTVAIPLRGQTA